MIRFGVKSDACFRFVFLELTRLYIHSSQSSDYDEQLGRTNPIVSFHSDTYILVAVTGPPLLLGLMPAVFKVSKEAFCLWRLDC